MAVAALAAAGLALSMWLTCIHYRLHNDPSYVSSCDFGEKLSCVTVAASKYSVFLSIPLAIWGILAYSTILLQALLEIVRGPRPGTVCVRFMVSGTILAASVALAWVSISVIGAICLLCFVVYSINFTIATVSAIETSRNGGFANCFKDLLKWGKSNPKTALAPLVSVAVVAAVLWIAMPRYWNLSFWLQGVTLPNGVDEQGNPWLGAESPDLVVHEYLDYECPHCRVAHGYIRGIIAKNEQSVRLVRHDFARMPCVVRNHDLSPSKCRLARAAHCAAQQGMFWEWNDAVLSLPKPARGLGRKDYERKTAERIGLDAAKFEKCFSSRDTYEYSQNIYSEALKRGVRETPSYVLDGKKMRLAELLKKIEEHMD